MKSILIGLLMLFFISNSTASNTKYSSDTILSYKNPLKYAHINEDGVLIEVNDNKYVVEDTKNEIIIISEYGFYPNYTMEPKVESGEESMHCAINSSMNDPNETKYCNSQFTTVTVGGAAVTVIGESIAAVFSLGLTVATGASGSNPYFSKELFFKTVKENDLYSVREDLLSKLKEKEAEANKKRQEKEAEANKKRQEKEAEANKIRRKIKNKHKKTCKEIENKIDSATGTKIIELYNELEKQKCN